MDGTQTPIVMRGEKLRKSFGGQTILNDASFTMRQGEVILLRGPNGSGKTTLLNMLTGNLEPDAGTLQIFGEKKAGEAFSFPQGALAALNPFNRFSPEGIAHEGLSRTWQDIRLFPSHSLRDNVALAIKHQIGERFLTALFRHRAVRAEQQGLAAQADALLGRFGLGGREGSSADMISLGQSKRVAIARSVQAGAHILLLDEPLAALDVNGINDVLGLLRDLVSEHKVTLLIVEHVFNIPRILDLATSVWTLREGKIVSEDPQQIRGEAIRESTDGVGPWLASLSTHSPIERHILPGGALLSSVRLDGAAGPEPMLAVEDLVVSRGHRPVVGRADESGRVVGLNFSIAKGCVAVLQAPNGWGKTTLLDALCGAIPPSRGRIVLNGRDVARLPIWERVRRGLCVMQSRDNAFPNLTVDESLKLARVDSVPQNVRPFLGKAISALSGGQRQKVAAACAMAGSAGRVMILDEPFSMLDMAAIEAIQAAIAANREGATLILLPAASIG